MVHIEEKGILITINMKLRLDNSAICTCFVVYFNLSQYLFTHELKYIMVSHFGIGPDLWNVGSLLRKKCNLCHLERVTFQRSKLQCALCTFISLLYSKNRLFDSCAIDSFCINSLKINISPYNRPTGHHTAFVMVSCQGKNWKIFWSFYVEHIKYEVSIISRLM